MSYPEKSYYDTLGVPRNATDSQIKAAYRAQIKYFHPDVFQGNPEVAKAKSLELNEAYSVLIDHEKRDKYDFWLKVKDYQRAQAQQREQETAQRESEKHQTAEQQTPPESDPAPDSESEPGPETAETTEENTEKDSCSTDPSSNTFTRPKSQRLNLAFSVICAVLLVCICILGYHSYILDETAKSLTAENAELNQQVESLKNENSALTQERTQLLKEKEDLQTNVDTLNDTGFEMWYQLYNIGFIVDGSPYYHRFDCSVYTSADSYLAHNTAYCEAHGFKQCPLCWK